MPLDQTDQAASAPHDSNNSCNNKRAVPSELPDMDCEPELALLSLALSADERESLDEPVLLVLL